MSETRLQQIQLTEKLPEKLYIAVTSYNSWNSMLLYRCKENIINMRDLCVYTWGFLMKTIGAVIY
jgi:CO dehydrogenase/acetyl-CoA synthase alpha subunit